MINLIGLSGKAGSGKDLAGDMLRYILQSDEPTYVDYLNGKYIIGADPHYWEIKKFADPVKDIVCLLTGCTKRDLEDPTFKAKSIGKEWKNSFGQLGFYADHTYRTLMQYIGTDLFRNRLNANTWINALFSNYNCSFGERYDTPNHPVDEGCMPPLWIITDVRFINEALAIRNRDGILIRMQRWTGSRVIGVKDKEYTDVIGVVTDYNDGICSITTDKDEKLRIPKEYLRQLDSHPSETNLDNYDFDYYVYNDFTQEMLFYNLVGIVNSVIDN